MLNIVTSEEACESAKSLMKERRHKDVLAALIPHIGPEQGNMKVYAILGNALLKMNKPAESIRFFETLHQSGRGDIVTTNTLGNAYLHNGEPAKAIAALKTLHDSGRGNIVTTNTLGNAYAITKDRNAFKRIKAAISPPVLADYLHAKCAYLEGDLKQARKIAQPYINHGDAPKNMIGVYMASIPSENTILHAQMRAVLGDSRYGDMFQTGESWQQNPLRAEAAAWKGSSTQALFELGGVGVSRADNDKAGLGMESRVAVRVSSTRGPDITL